MYCQSSVFWSCAARTFRSISCKPGRHQHLHLALRAIPFHMPKFTTCKTFNFACISLLLLLLRLWLWLWKSLHSGILERSKHNIAQVHRRIARTTCTTWSACIANMFFLEPMGWLRSLRSRCKPMGGVQAISFGHCFIDGLWTCHH